MSSKEKLDLRFLLPVFTSTIGIFIFLHFKIIELTTSEPSNDYLLSLSFCHYLSLICSIMAFVILANEGIRYVSIEKRFEIPIVKRAEDAQKQLLFFWPFLLIYSIVSLISVSLFPSFSFETRQILELIVPIILTFIITRWLLHIKFKLLLKMLDNFSMKFYLLCSAGYCMFVAIEVLSSSGVSVESEKKFYSQDENVHLIVKPKGYVFLPSIQKVDYGLTIEPIKNGSDHNYYFNLQDYNLNSTSLVEVIYKLQIFDIEKKYYFDINVIPKVTAPNSGLAQ